MVRNIEKPIAAIMGFFRPKNNERKKATMNIEKKLIY